MIRTFSELSRLRTLQERFNYLRLNSSIGYTTFGFDRYLNQGFYNSAEWKKIRREVIARDLGCEMGLDGYEIAGKIVVHHMNPVLPQDIVDYTDFLTDLEYLVCVSEEMHKAIHYSDDEILKAYRVVDRFSGDTCPWKVHI